MKIEQRAITDVRPYPDNPRVNDHAVSAVARSIQEFGFQQPIVVDTDGMIVVGHTRYKAALALGLEQVPVCVACDLTPQQVRAYRIADNKLADLASWNWDLLEQELRQLQDQAVDLELLGFSNDELRRYFGESLVPGQTDPDDIPQPPDNPVTQPGDLWLLGEHRLLCGDSANPAHVDRLLEGAAVHLVCTDPPYNVRVEPRSANAIAAGNSSFAPPKPSSRRRSGSNSAPQLRAKDRPLANDFVSDEEFRRLLAAWFGNLSRTLLPGRAFYIWGGYSNVANYPPALAAAGLCFSQSLIWVKGHPVMTRKDFMGDHEWCFYGWREGAAHQFFGPANATDVWTVKKVPPQQMVHLTEKPTELSVRAMQYSSRPGEHVLDLFGGSGSTLIAAQQTQRKAFLMEIDTAYCDVIVRRWEQFTGRQAERIPSAVSPLPPTVVEAS